ncbi:MAG: helix-turn-helix domain-containing protein [Microthrixaceae bacterium]
MAGGDQRAGLIPAMLKQWRASRGLSQLDLALAAGISARHVSFIETGRSVPSAEMVLCIGSTLGVPLRQVNAMLAAAGHDEVFDEPEELAPPVLEALEFLKSHHEPFPLVVVDRTYTVLDANRAATTLFGLLLDQPLDEADGVAGLNLARLTFDPEGAQPYLVNFDEVGRQALWRIQREVLADPDDGQLHELLDELLAMPTVSEDWREVNLLEPSDPAIVLHLRRDGVDLRFLTTVTMFQAPQNVAVEQMRIEQWFPYDEATAATCRALAAPAD